ncbi:MAG TPA: hypothetical protein PKH07_00345 [bacterium]|nr:hypothetical protein [bacterium]
MEQASACKCVGYAHSFEALVRERNLTLWSLVSWEIYGERLSPNGGTFTGNVT